MNTYFKPAGILAGYACVRWRLRMENVANDPLRSVKAYPGRLRGMVPWGRMGRPMPWCRSVVLCRDLVHHDGVDAWLWQCAGCGWWAILHHQGHGPYHILRTRLHSIVCRLDIASDDIPLTALHEHLANHGDDVCRISPRKFEALVRRVFREHFECDIHYFAGDTCSADGGIDLVMIQKGDTDVTAIQVKRRGGRTSESVSSVREFIGALVVEGVPKGVFVTTGRLTAPARLAAHTVGTRANGVEVNLMDGRGFYDLLRRTSPIPVGVDPWWFALQTAW